MVGGAGADGEEAGRGMVTALNRLLGSRFTAPCLLTILVVIEFFQTGSNYIRGMTAGIMVSMWVLLLAIWRRGHRGD